VKSMEFKGSGHILSVEPAACRFHRSMGMDTHNPRTHELRVRGEISYRGRVIDIRARYGRMVDMDGFAHATQVLFRPNCGNGLIWQCGGEVSSGTATAGRCRELIAESAESFIGETPNWANLSIYLGFKESASDLDSEAFCLERKASGLREREGALLARAALLEDVCVADLAL
jgi:hypothetical protein